MAAAGEVAAAPSGTMMNPTVVGDRAPSMATLGR